MTMNCNEVESRLADYLGGELSRSDIEALQTHLGSCARCRAEVDNLEAAQATLMELETVSPEHASRVTSRIVVRRRPAWPGGMLWVSLRYAAMLAVGVGIGLYLNKPSPDASAGRPMTASSARRSVAPAGIHPDWIQAAAEVARRQGDRSSFVRNLALLSTVGRDR